MESFVLEKKNNSRIEILIWATAFTLANFRGTIFWSIFKQGFRDHCIALARSVFLVCGVCLARSFSCERKYSL